MVYSNRNRVPEYFTDGLYGLARGQRIGNNAPVQRGTTAGEVIAKAALVAGTRMLATANKEEQLAEQRQFEESQLNVEKGLENLARKNEFDSEAFEKEASEQKADWIKEIPAEKRQDYNLMFDKYQSRYSGIIRNNEFKRQKEGEKATFLTAAQNYYQKAVTASRSGDDTELTDNVNGFMSIRKNLMDGGHISAESFVKMGQDFTDNIEQQKYLGEFDKIKTQGQIQISHFIGNFMRREDIPIEKRKKFANAMLSEYQTFQAQNSILLHDLREKSAFIQNSLTSGIEPDVDAAEVLNQLKSAGDMQEYGKLYKSLELGKEIKEFVKLTPSAMYEELATMKDNISDQDALIKYNSLQKVYYSAVKDLNEDPIQFAQSRKIIIDKGFDLTNPAIMEQRLENGRLLQTKYKLSYTPLISKAEAGALSNAINNNDSRQNAVLVGQIYSVFKDKSHDIFRKVAPKNPQFVHAAAIFENDQQAAVTILEGADIAKNQAEYTPKSEIDFDEVYYNRIDESMFSEMTSEWRGNLKKTVKSTMAKINYDEKKNDREVEDDYVKQAIKTVVGDIANIEMDGSGLLWDSSFKVPVPRGTSIDDFEDWYEDIDDNSFLEALTLAGKRPTAKEIHKFGTLHFVSDGKYRVRLNGELLYDKNGAPFVLTYQKAKEQ